MPAEFVHLHVHSHYSLLDATNRAEDLAAAARRDGMRAVALTDHGNLFGAIDFYKTAYAHGVKPIIGCELYVAPGPMSEKTPRPDKFERGFHLTCLAISADGYRNLVKLSSAGYLEGFYYNPRVDDEILQAHSEGLVVLSGCLSGEASKRYLAGDEAGAIKALRKYRDIFGRSNFFIELQDHGMAEQKRLLPFLLDRAREDDIPTVATNDVHYLAAADATAHDALLCIGTRALLREPDRKRYSSDQFYFKSPEEMSRLFAAVPDAVRRTVEIAERAELDLTFGRHHLPAFPVPIGEGDEADHLRRLVTDGMTRAGVAEKAPYQERVKHELEVILRKGFAGYFLIVSDFIMEARRRGIPVGPGRGSAAGSLVAWLLGITEVDPLPYGLLFERFLNPERTALPDIDVDICQERRDEVIEYVRARYGHDRVAQIITFGTFGARAVLRDVARIHDLTIQETEALVKLIPDQLKITLAESIKRVPELQEARSGPRRDLFEHALKLEGLARHASRHAAGIIISNVPITEVTPLYRDSEGHTITQYDMNSVAALGLLKIDILGLKTLTLIQHCLRDASLHDASLRRAGIDAATLSARTFDDPDVYALLSSGRTLGVFQLDSAGIRELIAAIRPSRFMDLAALISLYRPGPINLADEFSKRKHGTAATRYLLPELEPILDETYGIILYQEQVMEIAHRIGGFTMTEADELRKAMGKKDPELMAGFAARFVAGAVERQVPEESARELFAQMERFAGYGFNKSHAVAYAVLAYRTAWLKVHHPVAFMAALCSFEIGNRETLSLYIGECRRMGIELLPPHVNDSEALFAPAAASGGDAIAGTAAEGMAMRCGLAVVRNVGIGVAEEIRAERAQGPYRSLWDLLRRLAPGTGAPGKTNRRAIEALILAGAFDGLGATRRAMTVALPMIWERAARARADVDSDQINLFGEAAVEAPPRIEPLEEFPDLTLREFEGLGFHLREHPLTALFAAAPLLAAPAPDAKGVIRIAAVVSTLTVTQDKKGRTMARVRLETLDGHYDGLVFASLFSKRERLLEEGSGVIVRGRVEVSGRMLLDDVIPLASARWRARIRTTAEATEKALVSLEEALAGLERGPVVVELLLMSGGTRYRVETRHTVAPEALLALTKKSGVEAVDLAPD